MDEGPPCPPRWDVYILGLGLIYSVDVWMGNDMVIDAEVDEREH